MITDFIINVFFYLPYQLLSGMESLNINFALPDNFYDTFHSLLSGIGFVVPIAGLLPIFFITFNIYSFRIVWSLILRIKSFIPTMGN